MRTLTWLAAGVLALLAAGGCAAPADVAAQTPEPAAPRPAGPRPAPTYTHYVLQKGDTLYRVGLRFGVPWQEIYETNDLHSVSDLKPGRLLLIRRVPGYPVELPPAPANPSPGQATRRPVEPGELHKGRSSATFWWPTAGRVVRRYGTTFHGLADPGIAIEAPAGTEVHAAAAGRVITCVRTRDPRRQGWGNVVAVQHAGDMVTWYAHLARIVCREGQRVSKGQVLGTVGQTGAPGGPQLAFRIYRDERPVDPVPLLP